MPPIVDGVKAVMDWFSKLSEADRNTFNCDGCIEYGVYYSNSIVAAFHWCVEFGILPVIATIATVSLVITGIIMLIKTGVP